MFYCTGYLTHYGNLNELVPTAPSVQGQHAHVLILLLVHLQRRRELIQTIFMVNPPTLTLILIPMVTPTVTLTMIPTANLMANLTIKTITQRIKTLTLHRT
jgi:hypothetical protein